MEIKTYRARSLQQALQWIQKDLGPQAAVLHTRELRSGLMEWLRGRQLEVTAGVGVGVPSRFTQGEARDAGHGDLMQESSPGTTRDQVPAAHEQDYRARYRRELRDPQLDSPSLVEELCSQPASEEMAGPESLSQLFVQLREAGFDEESARELTRQVLRRSAPHDLNQLQLLKSRLARLIEGNLNCAAPIQLARGERRIVALVGPTGVGKTTTLAKLAANFHVSQRWQVGLVTVDTYRVAAVDQLRTYADIIDLPMEVASSPSEMQRALAKLADRDLVLLDTPGHSPSDVARLQELDSVLRRAQPNEIQLVVSGVSSLSSLQQAVDSFSAVGATSLILTKLDEAACLGHLWPLFREGRLPLSYITDGQNVPHDYSAVDARKLTRRILKWDGGS